MGLILFILFTALETALAVLSCTKFREKLERRRNKVMLRSAEIALLAVFIVLPAGQKWRFTFCLALLIIRLVIAGAAFGISRARKTTGECSKGGSIVNAVLNICLIGISLIPAFIFTGYNGLKTSGEYKVKETSAILVDESRLEAHETDGSHREVPIHFYYPEGGTGSYPFVLFAHGSFGYYQSNSSMYMELASNGYVVASIDHPYYAFFTEDTDGKTIIVDMDFMNTCINVTNEDLSEEEEAAYAKEWLSVRAADENFVLDSIKAAQASGSLSSAWYTKNSDEILNVINMTDMTKIGLTGHSIGGATAVKLGRERDDITAVIDIDGTMFSEKLSDDSDVYAFNETPYPIPLLTFNNASSFKDGYSHKDDKGRPYIDVYVLNNAVDGREYHIADTEHMDFTDLPLLSPTLAKMLGKGTCDPKKVIPEINGVVLNYFNYYLKGEGELTVGKWVPVE